MGWAILFSEDAEQWIDSLTDDEFQGILGSLNILEHDGPNTGRPAVDTIKGSRHHNMKELRSVGGHLRALFCFDPKRQAIILLGGDKQNDWTGWYERNIPLADDIYEDYLTYLEAAP